VTIASSQRVDDIVQGLQAVGVLGSAGNPSLVSELGEVAVLEEVVNTVGKADTLVLNQGGDQVVLADSGIVPSGRVALGDRPGGELQ